MVLKKYTLITATLLLTTYMNLATAGQADYQFEIGYERRQIDTDNTQNESETSDFVSFEYFLDMVKVDGQPLAEAAFMNRASSFAIGIGQFDNSADNRTGDGNSTSLLYSYMQKDSPLIFQILYGQQSADYDFKPSTIIDYSYDRTITGFEIGGFVKQYTAIALDYLTDEVDYSPAAYSVGNYTLTSIQILAKHLIPMGSGKMLNIEGTIGKNNYDFDVNTVSKNSENTVIELLADYYFTNRLSIGGTLSQISGDDNGLKGQAVAIRGKVFITPKVSLAAELNQFSGDGKSDDEDKLTFSAALRF